MDSLAKDHSFEVWPPPRRGTSPPLSLSVVKMERFRQTLTSGSLSFQISTAITPRRTMPSSSGHSERPRCHMFMETCSWRHVLDVGVNTLLFLRAGGSHMKRAATRPSPHAMIQQIPYRLDCWRPPSVSNPCKKDRQVRSGTDSPSLHGAEVGKSHVLLAHMVLKGTAT